VDRPLLVQSLAFKGGTCAAMLGFLDRFSVDLDFDVLNNMDEAELRKEFYKVFELLGFHLTLEFEKVLFFQLRYPSSPGKRNTIRVSATNLKVEANRYRVQYFPEIDRLINSQTVETMFANKLVALTDRYIQHKTIAGRDVYDIHHFLLQGYAYNEEVIRERTGLESRDYFRKMIDFIKQHVTQTIIDEDLNSLLPYQKFRQIRKILIPETLSILAKHAR
jgi:predicted nucleotidyltransferase component of viral defense system